MEDLILDWMAGLVGFPETADGNLTSGGSIASLIAVVAAREAAGLRARDFERAVVYASPHIHQCLHKALRVAGMGEAVRRDVAVDSRRRLRPRSLSQAVAADRARGLKPWLVLASAGTADTGAIDPLAGIADIAGREGLWYHVDAAYGGFFAMLPEFRPALAGMERADSVVLDPHKGMFLPYGTGAVLVRDGTALREAHAYYASYMQDAVEAETGGRSPAAVSPELTKHFRGLRVWLPLLLHGEEPLRACLREKLALARYFHREVEALGFEVGPDPELTVVTYRWGARIGRRERLQPGAGGGHAQGRPRLSVVDDDRRRVRAQDGRALLPHPPGHDRSGARGAARRGGEARTRAAEVASERRRTVRGIPRAPILRPPAGPAPGRPANHAAPELSMTIRSRIAAAFTVVLAAAACAPGDDAPDPASDETEDELVERARGIHDRVITLDTHIDISTSNFTAERNYTTDLPTQATLPKMETGGLDVGWFVVYTSQGLLNEEGYATAYENAVDKFDAIHRLVDEYAPDRIGLALTSGDVRRIAGEGRLVAMIGVENAYPLGTDIGRVEEFFDRGARYISLAHTGPSQLSDAHSGEQTGEWLHNGLSEMGREAVAEMNRLGIMIDISHPSKESIMQTLELTRAPVMASHSSARALSDVSRNLDDETLRAVAANGGVVQAVALGRFVSVDKSNARNEVLEAAEAEVASEMDFEILGRGQFLRLAEDDRAAYQETLAQVRSVAAERAEAAGVPGRVNVADFVDHVDYMVNLIGLEHVGISSDFDGGGGVEGWDDASETFNVTLELVRRGYTEEEIAMLWSGNLLRVLDEVQEAAAVIQAEEG